MVRFASVGRHGQESQIKKSRMYDPLTTRKYPFFTSIRHLVCHLSARRALPTQGEAFGLCTGDFPLYGTVPRVFMPNGKRCKMSLGLELSLRASSFYIYDIIKIGRIAVAFLGNAADRRRLRTAWDSVHGMGSWHMKLFAG